MMSPRKDSIEKVAEGVDVPIPTAGVVVEYPPVVAVIYPIDNAVVVATEDDENVSTIIISPGAPAPPLVGSPLFEPPPPAP
jgi:hypothetical protein